MFKASAPIAVVLVAAASLFAAANAGHTPLDDAAMLAKSPTDVGSTADHSKFEKLKGPFEDATQVTATCLKCHTEAAKQVHSSIHWHYQFDQPETGQRLGKRNIVNNLCFGIGGNYQRCNSCHVGYGWDDQDFDFTAETRVDCLVCHDTTGTYEKFPTAAGHPPYTDRMFQGELIEAPDLAEVAQNVGPSSRETCGSCHFEGGGGDAVKHGDLDSSLDAPPYSLDVHMSPDGADFSCSTCHTFSGHIQQGSRYQLTSPDLDQPVAANPHNKPACEACHGSDPHDSSSHDKLNQHGDFIACQTCHIPKVARGGNPTKILWDWSTAGRLDADGKPIIKKEDGQVIYHGRKGSFAWRGNYAPEYHWFDGNMHYTLLDDEIDPKQTVKINDPQGDHQTPGAKIWPFTSLKGRQPYDKEHNKLLSADLFGDEPSAYWQNYNWQKSLQAGMREAQKLGQTERDFSGEYGFVDSVMHWPVTHMVAPAEESLACQSCHERDGRMAGLEGLYVPGQHSHSRIELIGWWAIGLTLLAVLGHGCIRYLLYRFNRTNRPNPQEDNA